MAPRCVWLCVRLLVCLPECVLLGERHNVFIPAHVSVGECVCIRICAQIPVAVRVPERPILVHLHVSVPDLGFAYIRVPDADHIAENLVASKLSLGCV